jgi:RimJ/RimL family protein N-acetyltransferase
MSKAAAPKRRTYPYNTNLDGRELTLRLMTAKDRDSFLAFAQSLPKDDLLFLSLDITKAEVVDQLLHRIESGLTVTIIAELDGKITGHGSLTHNRLDWTRHLGEIQILINPDTRGLGLGYLLANELFALAKEKGLQKIVARMATEQRGAIQVFEKLGFKAEALLTDYVMDRDGHTHDLIVMSHDVRGFRLESV